MTLAIPASPPGRARALDRRAHRGAPAGRPRRGHGLPHDARPDHRAVVGARRAHTSIALWSGLGGAISALGPLLAGALLTNSTGARSSSSPCRWRSSRCSWPGASCPRHVNETSDPVDNLGGILSVVLVAALVLASTSRRCPTRGRSRWGLPRWRLAAGDRLRASASAARASPLYDLHVAGRRVFWVAALRGDHRLRLAHGRDVRRPAVPAERARLLDARRRALSIIPAARADGAHRAALGQARRMPAARA